MEREEGEDVTKNLQERVDRLAAGLLGMLHLTRGERIGAWMPNNAEWVCRDV